MHPKEEIYTPLLIRVLNSNESSDPFNEVILPSSDMYTSNTNLASKKHDDDDKLVHAHVKYAYNLCTIVILPLIEDNWSIIVPYTRYMYIFVHLYTSFNCSTQISFYVSDYSL